MPQAVIEISRVGGRGQGVGADACGNIYFVERALPGDEVRVEYKPDSRRYRDATLLEIIRHSPNRRASVCAYFQECGGCDWLNWNYASQLEAKDAMVTHQLSRVGVTPQVRLAIHRAEREFNYRTRVQLRFDANRIGFFRRKTRELVGIDSCAVSHAKINEFIIQSQGSLPAEGGKVEVAVTSNGELLCDWNRSHAYGGFTQVNEEQNAYLRERVGVYTSQSRNVLELFCGDGNLTVAYVGHVSELIGVDGSLAAIGRANERRIQGSFFHDVIDTKLLRRLPQDFLDRCDTLIIDPPRLGLGFDIVQIVPRQVSRLLYISCNASELATDASRLRASGFELCELQCIDMFPQTRHVESLAVFVRDLVH